MSSNNLNYEKYKDKKNESAINSSLAAVSNEVVYRYGSAVKEHVVAYSGVDNEINKELTKGLKDISQYKVDTNNEYSNLKQQSGFAAEVKYVARENAENIINKNEQRVVRTDDVEKVNDELYDHFRYDKNKNIIDKSQMKFVGKNPEEALQKLASKDYQKYLDNDIDIDVPSEMYEGIKEEAQNKAKSCLWTGWKIKTRR